MNGAAIELLGWTATAVFVGSYFFVRPSRLRGIQMVGALLWVIYGLAIHASPVIVANLLVFSARRVDRVSQDVSSLISAHAAGS